MTPPRVLLVNPWIYDFAAFDFWAKPLGLLYIADSLRKKGVDITFIGCLRTGNSKRYGTGHFLKQEIPKPTVLKDIPRKYSRYGISEEDFIQELKSSSVPDVVLVTSVMTYWYPGVFRAIQLIRENFPATPIILGGIYASLCHAHAIQFSGADHVYRGKVTRDFFQLLARYITINVEEREDPVMDCRPAIDLTRNPKYGALTTSEGCPFSCSYCASNILNPCFRQKNYRSCFEEIVWMNRTLGMKDIAFYDDALLVGARSHFLPLMDMVCHSGLNINFHVPNGLHIREITPEVAMVLKRSGFRTIRLGLETTGSGKERQIDNKVSCEELVQAISALKSAGFEGPEIGVYLLSGFPSQTREETEESMAKVAQAGARPYLSEFSPIPGTEMWDMAKQASVYPLESEPLFQNPSLSPCAPEGFTVDRFHWRRSILRNL